MWDYDFNTARRLTGTAVVALVSLWAATPEAKAEDARVLPAGVGRVTALFAQTTGISQTFDAGGHAESLTAPYNIDLSSGNLRSFAPELAELISGLNTLMPGARYNSGKRDEHYGLTYDPNDPTLGDALSRGFLSVGAEAKHQESQFGIMYGVTSKLSVGFMVPLIKNRVVVSHDISGPNTAEDIYNAILAQGPQGTDSSLYNKVRDGLDLLRRANDESLQQILLARGYSRFDNYEGTGMGDIVAGARYNYYNQKHDSGEWISSAQLGVTMPTGKLRPPSELTQLDFGQGAWDVGIANILNWQPNSYVQVSHGVHWTHRLWDRRLMRVRKDAADFIPDSSGDEIMDQFLGDKYWTSLGLKLQPTGALSLTTSYEWYWKTAEEYHGSRPDSDYTYMADKTDKYLETWQIGVSVSSVSSFLKHEFLFPAEISFDVFIPLKGKNTPIAPYGVAQLGLFF